jgi:hypothetical protein
MFAVKGHKSENVSLDDDDDDDDSDSVLSICMEHFFEGTNLPLVPFINYNHVRHFSHITRLTEIATMVTGNEIVNVMDMVLCKVRVQAGFYVLCFCLHILRHYQYI